MTDLDTLTEHLTEAMTTSQRCQGCLHGISYRCAKCGGFEPCINCRMTNNGVGHGCKEVER